MAGPNLTQSLQQRMQLTLAPQLRQSLEILQVPALELRSLIQQEMEMNPTLEEIQVDPDKETAEKEDSTTTDESAAAEEKADAEAQEAEAEESAAADAEADFEFEQLAQMDDEWRDYLSQHQPATTYNRDAESKKQFVMDSLSQPISLQQHLMEQISLADLNEEEVRLAELIIGSMDDDGYLTSTIEELADSTGEDLEILRDILGIIRDFDPIGVGAVSLSDCLGLQLKRLGRGDGLAAHIVEEHLERLAGHKYQEIARLLDVHVEAVEKEARLIGTLEPKPGRRFVSESTSYVQPEVTVRQNDDGDYILILNNDYIPHLHVSEHYRKLMHNTGTTKDVKKYIRDKVRSSMFLIKSINQRQQTIHNIASEIVRIQKEFLDKGVTFLRPLTMAEVAGIVGVHETTVSRAIAGKYIQTPRGMFEMKYFFTPGFKGSDGQSVSNQVIKDAIQKLVDEESPAKPLSDQSIVTELKAQGFKVARRTIAKYREELKILPSHLRKGFSDSQ